MAGASEDGTSPVRREAAESALRRLIADPTRGLIRVIERGGEPAGSVAPTHRGLELGRRAVEWAEAASREHGAGAAAVASPSAGCAS